MNPWEELRVGKPATTGFNNACTPFKTISHTSHLEPALSIIDTDEIRPGLVFDKCILNDQRILVSWLSPNTWGPGYRYGNIKFDFDFSTLIEGKKFYWVEAIAYEIKAARILVTDKDYSSHKKLLAYDPKIGDGPWWHDTQKDQHYFNGNLCLEFMFESSIRLKALTGVDLVKHHDLFCSIHRNAPSQCTSLGSDGALAGAQLLARLAGQNATFLRLKTTFVREDDKPTHMFQWAFDQLYRKTCPKNTFSGELTHSSTSGQALARAACLSFSYGSFDDARELASLFESEREFLLALAQEVGRTAGLPKWKRLAQDY